MVLLKNVVTENEKRVAILEPNAAWLEDVFEAAEEFAKMKEGIDGYQLEVNGAEIEFSPTDTAGQIKKKYLAVWDEHLAKR